MTRKKQAISREDLLRALVQSQREAFILRLVLHNHCVLDVNTYLTIPKPHDSAEIIRTDETGAIAYSFDVFDMGARDREFRLPEVTCDPGGLRSRLILALLDADRMVRQ